jgi:hypothetical protein
MASPGVLVRRRDVRVTVLRGQDPTRPQRVITTSCDADLNAIEEGLRRDEDIRVTLPEGGADRQYRVVGIYYSRDQPAIEVESVE